MNWELRIVVLDTCILDPCPSLLVKATRKGAGGWIHAILNSSLREEMIPLALKEAVKCPLLKSPFEDLENLDNFHRKCSTFLLLGKVVEKAVSLQLQRVMDKVDDLDYFQSKFILRYNTEMGVVMFVDYLQ